MATDFDEYAYLEKQLEAKDSNGQKENGSSHKKEKKERREKSRDRDRDKDRKSSKREHRDGSREQERKRHHSSHEHSRHDKDRKHRTRSPERRRERTPPEVREAREKERELRELDRDIRTVFAYNLPLKADERDLFEFFSAAGTVEDVRIIMDRNTRRSKGFAYIEYGNREDIVNALALTGQIFMGQAIMVKSSEAEKNLAWEAAQAQNASVLQLNTMATAGAGPCKLYITNLHANIQEPDLKQIFEAFGPLDLVSLQRDPAGRSLGQAYVQYQMTSDANKAMQQLDGLDIAGSHISVKLAPLLPADVQATTTAAAAAGIDLDEAEGEYGGLKLTANARAALMQRLSGAAGGSGANTTPLGVPSMTLPGPPPMVPASGPVMSADAQALALEQGLLGPASPIPTQCLLLKNMFDPKEETEPEWDQDIATDVKEECSKYGAVLHTHVDKDSKGFVYLKFMTVEGSAAAQKALHGRWFAGRQIVAEFQFTAVYGTYFKV